MKKGNDKKNKKNRLFELNPSLSSPGDHNGGNSPKRSRKGYDPLVASDVSAGDNNPDKMEFTVVENVASQVTVAESPELGASSGLTSNRLSFINAQKKNRYSSSNHPPFIVHIESLDGNIGNVHPMRLGKALSGHYPAIQNIKRLGKNIIAVRFKREFSFDANDLAQSVNILPGNWVVYIPNYKIIRIGIVRGVDPSLSVEEIFQGLKWLDRPLEIRSIERLKFRDKNNDNELRISSSVKIEFVSNFLPEFISICKI